MERRYPAVADDLFAPPSALAGEVDGSTYTPTATATSGLPGQCLQSTRRLARRAPMSAGVVSFISTGSRVIDANQQAANGTYGSAAQVQQFSFGQSVTNHDGTFNGL